MAFYIENLNLSSNLKPKLVIEWGIFDILIAYLDSEHEKAFRPILRIIGYMSYGTCEEINMVFTSKAVATLENLLKFPMNQGRWETCWIISNLIIDNESAYRMFYRPSVLYTVAEMILFDSSETVVVEALSVFNSFIHEANPAILNDLVHGIKIVPSILESLKRKDERILEKALQCIDGLIRKDESFAEFNQQCRVVEEIYSSENFVFLEKLLNHSNRDIHKIVDGLLSAYFSMFMDN